MLFGGPYLSPFLGYQFRPPNQDCRVLERTPNQGTRSVQCELEKGTDNGTPNHSKISVFCFDVLQFWIRSCLFWSGTRLAV